MVFDNPVMHHHNMVRNMRMRVTFRRFAVRRPAGMGNPGTAVQRMFFQRLGQHLYFPEAANAVQMTFVIDDGQTGGVITAVFQTT